MSRAFFALLGTSLLLTFITCCVVSAVLQIVAWSRHSRPGVRVDLKALWSPEGYFDGVGRRQVRLARTVLLIGGVAYLTFGALVVMGNLVTGTR
ncbi:MAG: hypothetical protein ACREKN_05105 [Longimicrobiaceae bacterium]